MKHVHESTFHGGPQSMMFFLRNWFWIPKLRQEAKCCVKTRTQCTREAQITARQIMAELPQIRIKLAPPFQHVGVDMAGPYILKITDKFNMNTRAPTLPDMKGWIAVFVCLVTRAVHLEPTEGMSTDDFLQAYQRFVSRRGNPAIVFSDNGTNFVGAQGELKKFKNVKMWESEEIQDFVHAQETEWHFITPSAPHDGGVWKAAVKSMKYHLKRVMGSQKYSLQGITTLLTSVETCLNSKPLRFPMHEKAEENHGSLQKLFKYSQIQIQLFWKQWSNEYLHTLMQMLKWREEQKNLEEGQLVLIKSDNVPPTYWAMGKIVKTHVGADAKVRSITLCTQTGELERSIRKLCVLPSDVELQYWRNDNA